MSIQIPDTVKICGIDFHVKLVSDVPSKHLSIQDPDLYEEQKILMDFPRSSAAKRGYVAEWELKEDGTIWLTSISGRYRLDKSPILADWVSTVLSIPIGEVDESKCRPTQMSLPRKGSLDLNITDGKVNKWILWKDEIILTKDWVRSFDCREMINLLQENFGPDFQPPRVEPTTRLGFTDHAKVAAETAAILQRATSGEPLCGASVVDVESWKRLSRGWGDPLPELDVHQAIRTLRGHGSQI